MMSRKPSGDAPVTAGVDCTWDDLDVAAGEAAVHSHSPYSGFRVGAAVLGAAGDITRGTNVESASYGLTCCAERVALFAHIAGGGSSPVALSVNCVDGSPDDPASVSPCGACRQVMLDLAGPDLLVSVVGVGVYTAADLLPYGFRL